MKKNHAMLFFFSLVLIIFGLVNFYIYKRTQSLFLLEQPWGLILQIVFFIVVLSFPLGKILEGYYPSSFTISLLRIGSFWLGAMLYLTLIFALMDVAHVVYKWFNLSCFFTISSSANRTKTITVVTYGIVGLILLGGYINARLPRVHQIAIQTDKTVNGEAPLRIVAASDIHLGSIIGSKRLEKFVRLVNSQKPDLVLIAGDVFDDRVKGVIADDLGRPLSELSATQGIYAIPGNHEYIGGVDQAIDYLEKLGITVLRDSITNTSSNVAIVGRDDKQSVHMGGENRKSIDELMQKVNASHYVILLDHQPFNLQEHSTSGIDLQISGHTHHGQVFPFNLITNAIFEVSRGHVEMNNTHFIVSTGYGTWGPPIRIGNRPEIMVIDITNSQLQ